MDCQTSVVGGAPLGAICGSYLHWLTLAWLVYFIDAVQLIVALAVVGSWIGRTDGSNTATPLHLCLTSAPLFCDGAVFFKAVEWLGVRLMEQVLEERGEKDGNRGKEEPRAPRAIVAERHLEDQAEAKDGDNDNVVAWNMCQRVHKYGMWCDANCQALDTFHVNEWSRSNAFLVAILCVLVG